MFSEGIAVQNEAEYGDVALSVGQVSVFLISQSSPVGIFVQERDSVRTLSVPRETKRELDINVWPELPYERWRGGGWYYFNPDYFTGIQCNAFARVGELSQNLIASGKSIPVNSRLDPSSLIDLKVVAQIVPLKSSYDSVSDSKNDSSSFKALFPL